MTIGVGAINHAEFRPEVIVQPSYAGLQPGVKVSQVGGGVVDWIVGGPFFPLQQMGYLFQYCV